MLYSVLQSSADMRLGDDFFKRPGTVFAGQHQVAHGAEYTVFGRMRESYSEAAGPPIMAVATGQESIAS